MTEFACWKHWPGYGSNNIFSTTDRDIPHRRTPQLSIHIDGYSVHLHLASGEYCILVLHIDFTVTHSPTRSSSSLLISEQYKYR